MAAVSRPDVVLMDLRMPRSDGVAGTIAVLRAVPTAKVMVLTALSDVDHIIRALEAGASGYLLKDAPAQDVVDGRARRDGRRVRSEGGDRRAGQASRRAPVGARRRAAAPDDHGPRARRRLAHGRADRALPTHRRARRRGCRPLGAPARRGRPRLRVGVHRRRRPARGRVLVRCGARVERRGTPGRADARARLGEPGGDAAGRDGGAGSGRRPARHPGRRGRVGVDLRPGAGGCAGRGVQVDDARPGGAGGAGDLDRGRVRDAVRAGAGRDGRRCHGRRAGPDRDRHRAVGDRHRSSRRRQHAGGRRP